MELDKYKYFENVLPFIKISKIDIDDDIVKLSSIITELNYYDIVLENNYLIKLQDSITKFINKEKKKSVIERNINPIFKIDNHILRFHLEFLLKY